MHVAARLGPEDALFTYNSDTNRNGEKLVEFMEEFNLVASNTRFMKPLCKLWSLLCARLAQLVRSLTANQKVPGSIPGLVEG